MKAIEVYNKAVGANLRKKRIEAGLSQEEVGRWLGITFQQVQKYERATNRISAGYLMHLAKCFGCQVVEFFDMPELGEVVLEDGKATKRAIGLVRAIDNIENLIVVRKLEKLILAMGKEVPIAN